MRANKDNATALSLNSRLPDSEETQGADTPGSFRFARMAGSYN